MCIIYFNKANKIETGKAEAYCLKAYAQIAEDNITQAISSFDKAIKTIHHLKKIQKTYDRINIGIIITFTNQNQKKFKDIIKGIYSLVEPDNISINLVRGDPKQKVNLDLDLDILIKPDDLKPLQ